MHKSNNLHSVGYNVSAKCVKVIMPESRKLVSEQLSKRVSIDRPGLMPNNVGLHQWKY
jgi:hypothetical protein